MNKSLSLFLLTILFVTVLGAQQTPLPITSYDYAIPENNVSPIAMAMGAINLSNVDDPYAAYTNPALLAYGELNSFSTSFRLRNSAEINFWEAANISNALKDKQFKYFVVNAKQASFSYQPVAGVHLSEFSPDGYTSRYYDYQLDKLQISLGAKDQKFEKLGAGISLKYLSGRLVYLTERKVGNTMVREGFIDDKIKGFSTDLGFTFKQGNVTYAGTAYDIVSRMWWENYDAVSIKRRMALGMGWDSESSHFVLGVQSRISSNPETTYHLGYGYTWDFGTSSTTSETSTKQTMDIRAGVYSKNFYGTGNINYTLGGGYNYHNIRFDFSLNNTAMKLSDSEYLFSLGLGI
ncbi:MAG: hypothetical protein PHO32_03590 [Candidatus Cloacimonetes bacterium]|nr:hypothetical protein [Candidatus Cloacimonadota bacterium]